MIKLIDRFDLLDGLPTISLTAQRIGELVNDPRTDAQAIAHVLRSDQSLAAKVLKIANSSYYAIPGGVNDVSRAISFLGFNTLYQLVLSVSVLAALNPAAGSAGLDPRALWLHAFATATVAEVVARRLHINPEGHFTAALLHDIGKVALLHVAPEEFTQAVLLAREKSMSLSQAELGTGLPNHVDIGARLAERWRFPMPLRVAISHERYLAPGAHAGLPPGLGTYVDITALANTLARRSHLGDPGDAMVPELDKDVLARLNLTSLHLDALRDDLMRALDKSRTLLDLLGADVAPK